MLPLRALSVGVAAAVMITCASAGVAETGADHPKIYIPSISTGELIVVDQTSQKELKRISTAIGAIDLHLTPDGQFGYVVHTWNRAIGVVRLKCPASRDWTAAEKLRKRCEPDTVLEPILVKGRSSFIHTIGRANPRWVYSLSLGEPGELGALERIDTRSGVVTFLRDFSGNGTVTPDGKILWLTSPAGLEAVSGETGQALGRSIAYSEKDRGSIVHDLEMTLDGRFVVTLHSWPSGIAEPGAPARNADQATFGLYDTKTLQHVGDFPLAAGAHAISMDINVRQAWSANTQKDVSVLLLRDRKVVNIPTPYNSVGVALTSDGKGAWVTMIDGNIWDVVKMSDPVIRNGNMRSYVQLYSTSSFEPIGPLVDLGNTTVGVPKAYPPIVASRRQR